jgi:hypothetical protein
MTAIPFTPGMKVVADQVVSDKGRKYRSKGVGKRTATPKDGAYWEELPLEESVFEAGKIQATTRILSEATAEDGQLVYVRDREVAGDNGGGVFYFDATCTLPEDGIMVFGSGVGRFRRHLTENKLWLTWFGGRADCNKNSIPFPSTTDNLLPLYRALDFIVENPQFHTLVIPAGQQNHGCYFSETPIVKTQVSIIGESAGGMYNNTSCLIVHGNKGLQVLFPREYFYVATQDIPAGKKPLVHSPGGVWERYPNKDFQDRPSGFDTYTEYNEHQSYKAGAKVKLWAGANEATVLGVNQHNIVSQLYQEDGQEHGFFTNTRVIVRGMFLQNFKGSGFVVRANAADTPYPSNANMWSIKRSGARFCAGHGIHIAGGDVNVGVLEQFDATSNKYCNILDESLLSIVGIATHSNNNGVYEGSTCKVYDGDIVKHRFENGDVWCFSARRQNKGVPLPLDTQKNDDWLLLEAGDYFPLAPEWNAETTYEPVYFYQVKQDCKDVRPTRQTDGYYTLVGLEWALYAGMYHKWEPGKLFRVGGDVVTTSAVGASVFLGHYAEQNQGHALMRGGSFMLGGERGTPVMEGTLLRGGSGGLAVSGNLNAGGIHAQDNGTQLMFGEGETTYDSTKSLYFRQQGPLYFGNPMYGGYKFHFNPHSGHFIFGAGANVNGGQYQFAGGNIHVSNGDILVESPKGSGKFKRVLLEA